MRTRTVRHVGIEEPHAAFAGTFEPEVRHGIFAPPDARCDHGDDVRASGHAQAVRMVVDARGGEQLCGLIS